MSLWRYVWVYVCVDFIWRTLTHSKLFQCVEMRLLVYTLAKFAAPSCSLLLTLFPLPTDCTFDVHICWKMRTIESWRRTRKTCNEGAWQCFGTPKKDSTMADRPGNSSSFCLDRFFRPTTLCLNILPSTRTQCRFHRSRLSLITATIGKIGVGNFGAFH